MENDHICKEERGCCGRLTNTRMLGEVVATNYQTMIRHCHHIWGPGRPRALPNMPSLSLNVRRELESIYSLGWRHVQVQSHKHWESSAVASSRTPWKGCKKSKHTWCIYQRSINPSMQSRVITAGYVQWGYKILVWVWDILLQAPTRSKAKAYFNSFMAHFALRRPKLLNALSCSRDEVMPSFMHSPQIQKIARANVRSFLRCESYLYI